jgi:hypothetical protein
VSPSFCNDAQTTKRRLPPLGLRCSEERITFIFTEVDRSRLVQTSVGKDSRNSSGCSAESPSTREASTGNSERISTDDSLFVLSAQAGRVGREGLDSRRRLGSFAIRSLGWGGVVKFLVFVIEYRSILSSRCRYPEVVDVECVFLVC